MNRNFNKNGDFMKLCREILLTGYLASAKLGGVFGTFSANFLPLLVKHDGNR